MFRFIFGLGICLLYLATVTAEFVPSISFTKQDIVAKAYAFFDDSETIVGLRDYALEISYDTGKSWKQIDAMKDIKINHFQLDHIHKNRGFAFSVDKGEFVTNDRGKTWNKFSFEDGPVRMDTLPTVRTNVLEENFAILSFYQCPSNTIFSAKCEHRHYFTNDGFKTPMKRIPLDAAKCLFIASTPEMGNANAKSIICAARTKNSFGHVVESKLIRSDDFFKTQQPIDHKKSNTGNIIDIRVAASFVVAIVQNDKFNTKSSVSLLVSKDGSNFEEADFAVKFSYGQISFVESSPSSMFITVKDLASHWAKPSTLYVSDSTGLHFRPLLENIVEYTLQKVQTIDGVWIAETVEQDKPKLGHHRMGSKKTVMSFDNGETWNPPKIDKQYCDSGDCTLQIINSAERDGEGNIVTGPTPGILMAIGYKGSKLEDDPKKWTTWISVDGGVSWKPAIDEACSFIFGDLGNIIVAVALKQVDYFYYSLDHGESWQKSQLPHLCNPMTLTTAEDGTSTKFFLTGWGSQDNSNKRNEFIYNIDFSKAFNGKKCNDNDLEKVYARILEGEPSCIYGHKEFFMRRKADAKCFIDKLFEDVHASDEACDCTIHDYECAPGFMKSLNDESCAIDPRKLEELCKDKKEIELPDKQLIAGHTCKEVSQNYIVKHKISCTNKDKLPQVHSDIVTHKTVFDGNLLKYTYFELTETSPIENMMLRTSKYEAYASNNGGSSFVKIPFDGNIVGYYTGFLDGHVIAITNTKKFFVSIDGINHFEEMEAPVPPSKDAKSVSFHPETTDKFMWIGNDGAVYYTKDGGHTFKKLPENIEQCEYVQTSIMNKSPTNDTIICTRTEDDTSSSLIMTDDYCASNDKSIMENIVAYGISGNYIVAAFLGKDGLTAKVTMDGEEWAQSTLPPNLNIHAENFFTILDSSTKALFLHFTTNQEGGNFGPILKSNSNGTLYSLSLDNVNSDANGYVDFERIDILEGTIIANIVTNTNDVKNGKPKNIKTQISHNDGGEWLYIQPPAKDSKGRPYKCKGSSLEKCSLNLHGYTERRDYRDSFSSESAVGVIIGIGNVGEALTHYSDASTFISRDGGITWSEIIDSVYMWEFGDHGTILVIVDEVNETDTLKYSLDEGLTWNDYKFAQEKIKVLDLATIPSDTSKKFVIFGVYPNDMGKTYAYGIDFSNIYKRQCQLDLDNPVNDDYEYWTPKHPMLPDNCLFGHKAAYLRRALGHYDCFIGKAPLQEGFKTIQNCSCTRRDYECDYNYYRDVDNTCKLVPGLNSKDRMNEVCSLPGAFEYFESTGYRKIPLSTCVGGKQFDSWNSRPCPGKETEYNQHYGKEISGFKAFIIIFIPLFVFLFSVWFVYDRGVRRNGGFKRLGQIRLDLEDDDFQPIEDNAVDKVVNKIVHGGIVVAAATIAFVKAVRKIDKALMDKLLSLIFRRGSSSRRYVNIPDFEEDEELFNNMDENYEREFNQDTTHYRDDADDITNFDINDRDASDVDSQLFNIDEEEEETPNT